MEYTIDIDDIGCTFTGRDQYGISVLIRDTNRRRFMVKLMQGANRGAVPESVVTWAMTRVNA